MSKQANPVVIGGFVLGALALLVFAILVFSSGALFKGKEQLVSYFPGTVKGLSVGARVEFQGVQVGQVTRIEVEYYTEEGRFSVPVHYEIWSDTAKIIGDQSRDMKEAYRELIEKQGLRAKLESVSLVTGQYMVALDLYPGTPVRRRDEDRDAIEIPTLEADRDRLAKLLEGIDLEQLVNSAISAMNAVRELAEDEGLKSLIKHADETVVEAQRLVADIDAGINPLLQRIDATLVDYSALANTAGARVNSLADSLEATSAELRRLTGNVDSRVGAVSKSAVGAFEQARSAFKSVDGLVGEDSQPRYDLELLLKEASGAARSLRILADYLQQNPDALIKGK